MLRIASAELQYRVVRAVSEHSLWILHPRRPEKPEGVPSFRFMSGPARTINLARGSIV